MVNIGAGVLGAFFFAIAVFGFLAPVNNLGHTIPETNELCDSGMGQLAQIFGGQNIQQVCEEYKYLTYGIYGSGLILVIVGAVVPKR